MGRTGWIPVAERRLGDRRAGDRRQGERRAVFDGPRLEADRRSERERRAGVDRRADDPSVNDRRRGERRLARH